MKVICINPKESTKLIKGGIYTAISLQPRYRSTNEKSVHIKNIGTYNALNFTTLDGTELYNINNFNGEETTYLDASKKDYTGHFVKCRYSSGKSLKENEIYYVEKQVGIRKKSYNGSFYFVYKFKIRGVKNPVDPYNFYEIPITEQRNIKLKSLKGEKHKTGDQTRKFLLYSEKEKIAIFFELLAKVLKDIKILENTSDLNIDISDLIIKKGKRYAIIKEDIEPYTKKYINTLLKKFI